MLPEMFGTIKKNESASPAIHIRGACTFFIGHNELPIGRKLIHYGNDILNDTFPNGKCVSDSQSERFGLTVRTARTHSPNGSDSPSKRVGLHQFKGLS